MVTQLVYYYCTNFLSLLFKINHKNGSQQVNYLFSVWFIHANELPLGIYNDDLMSVYEMSINSLNH